MNRLTEGQVKFYNPNDDITNKELTKIKWDIKVVKKTINSVIHYEATKSGDKNHIAGRSVIRLGAVGLKDEI